MQILTIHDGADFRVEAPARDIRITNLSNGEIIIVAEDEYAAIINAEDGRMDYRVECVWRAYKD